MLCMPDMTLMSSVAIVTPHTSKIINNNLDVFEKGEHLLQNGIHCIYVKSIFRNRVIKLEFRQMKK